ncbi:MAG: GCN5-related N-acetyltransferase [Gammaproteobacteria bacterium]|nr:GCN5-related N-acetyltransferase [Gammaproteobacteria bacterium]
MVFFPKLHSDAEDRDFIAGRIERTETWIAVEDGRIGGLACMDRDWLTHLYVRATSHNRGIGSALLNHVKALHPDGFQLWTFQANAGARRFYERHGCLAVEFTDGQGNEEKLPDIRYVWKPACPQSGSPEALDSNWSPASSADEQFSIVPSLRRQRTFISYRVRYVCDSQALRKS